MNRDHVEIVKFKGMDDPEYEKVRDYLEYFLSDSRLQKASKRWDDWELQTNPNLSRYPE
jgi:hypothetical protein